MAFTQWDASTGTMKAGQIKRVSESTNKTWGETNQSGVDLASGTFVAMSADGGVTKIAKNTDIVHGIVVRGVYGDKCPADQMVDVGHFSHGDEVVALAVSGVSFNRGEPAYIVATGSDVGKVTNVAENCIDLGYWVTEVSAGNSTVAITLGFIQTPIGGGA